MKCRQCSPRRGHAPALGHNLSLPLSDFLASSNPVCVCVAEGPPWPSQPCSVCLAEGPPWPSHALSCLCGLVVPFHLPLTWSPSPCDDAFPWFSGSVPPLPRAAAIALRWCVFAAAALAA